MFATLLLFIPGLFADGVVEFGKKNQFCVLEGSSVEVSCSFSIKNDGIKEVFFFNTNNKMKWKDTTIPESVSEDEEYYGRLQRSGVAGGGYRLMLVITDLRPTDSGDYKCRINTYTSGWKNSDYGSTVDVTGLKVRINPDTVQEGQRVTLTCDTKCTLSGNSNPTYIWYKNGQRLTNLRTINNRLYLDSFSTMDSGSYTCAVNDIHSPALCLLDNCWDVRYNKTICAIEGSSVDLPCTYTYPSGQTITQTLWSKTVDSSRTPKDLEYGDVVQYHGDNETDCTLRLKELRKSDSAKYSFSFKTQQMSYSGPFKVTLSVTDIQVMINPSVATEGEPVWIYCKVSCIPKRNSTGFIFYKDNVHLPLLDKEWMNLNPVSSDDAGIYSCALVGLEHYRALAATLIVNYPPRSTTVKVSRSQKTVLGSSSVILTCDSDANPPVDKYIWYKRNGSAVSVLQGETKRFINSAVSLKDQYFCEAHNKIGAQNSTWDIVEDVTQSPLMISVLVVVAVLTTGTLLVFGYYILKRRHGRESQLRADTQTLHSDTQRGHSVRSHVSTTIVNESESRENIYADPDEYVNVQDDTYTALQGDPGHSAYITMTKRTSP